MYALTGKYASVSHVVIQVISYLCIRDFTACGRWVRLTQVQPEGGSKVQSFEQWQSRYNVSQWSILVTILNLFLRLNIFNIDYFSDRCV